MDTGKRSNTVGWVIDPAYESRKFVRYIAKDFMTTSSLLWGLVFGSVGLAYFIYGKKQRAVVPLVCGLALMIFPYFVSGTFALVGIGGVLAAIPYFIRL